MSCISRMRKVNVASGWWLVAGTRDALQRDPGICAVGRAPARSGDGAFRRVFATTGTVGTRSRAMRGSTSEDPCRVQRLRWSMRSGASGVACLDAFFAVSATRARECRLYSGPFPLLRLL